MPTFNPSKIRKAVEEFIPHRPEKFQELITTKDFIIELRRKRASYRSIADLLTRHSLPTSKTSIAAFCHKILGETIRPYRHSKRAAVPALAGPEPEAKTPVPTAPTEAGQPLETQAPEPALVRSRGPRIAQVRMIKPQPPTP